MVVLTSFPPPTEGIRHREANTHAHVGRKSLGRGTVFIAESRVSWVSDAGEGFSLEYPAISIHAVSRDLSAFPQECVYLMLDTRLDDPEDDVDRDNSESEDDEENNFTEVRFIPEDKTVLDTLFHSLSDCQALHPDPNDSDSGDDYIGEEGGDDINEDDEDDDGVENGSTDAGNLIYRRDSGDGDDGMDTSQFEDAEPDH